MAGQTLIPREIKTIGRSHPSWLDFAETPACPAAQPLSRHRSVALIPLPLSLYDRLT